MEKLSTRVTPGELSGRQKRTCPCCQRDRVGPVRVWRRLTQYAADQENYLRSCVHCIREDDGYYAELWNGYYADQGVGMRAEVPHRPGRRPTIVPLRYARANDPRRTQ